MAHSVKRSTVPGSALRLSGSIPTNQGLPNCLGKHWSCQVILARCSSKIIPVAGLISYVTACQARKAPLPRRGPVKCLASWSLARPGELLVQPELEELRNRLSRSFQGRFRWINNPTAAEMRARLRLECVLFLQAGHGKLRGDTYYLELKEGDVAIDELKDELRISRTEVLVLDCCESGLGHSKAGVPRLMRQLPSVTCVVGMQGPASDIVSRLHVPALVERLLVGEPVWRAVNLLRLDLHELGREDWLLPVLHLKRSYQPFAVAASKRLFLDALLDSLGP